MIASVVEWQLLLDEVQFKHENGEILAVYEKEDCYCENFPVVEQTEKRTKYAYCRDCQKYKGCPVLSKGKKRYQVQYDPIDIFHQNAKRYHVYPAGDLAIYLLSTKQKQDIHHKLLDQSLRNCLLPELRADQSENHHVSEERPVQEELPREILKYAGLGEAVFLSFAQKPFVDVSLCKVQGKGQEHVRTNSQNRVVGEEQLRYFQQFIFFHFQRITRTTYFLLAYHNISVLVVEDKERVAHFLEHVDRTFGKIVERVDFQMRIRVNREVIGRVQKKYLLISQIQWAYLGTLTIQLCKLDLIEIVLHVDISFFQQDYIAASQIFQSAQLSPNRKIAEICSTDRFYTKSLATKWASLRTRGGKLRELGGKKQ